MDSRERLNLKKRFVKPEYEEEPVFYCKECLSLNIRELGDTSYCEDCGSTEVDSSSLEEWEEKYKEKYNHYLI